jgi:hypothetical protein
MGLTVDVFHNPLGDCTNHGISSQATRLTIVNVEGSSEPSDDAPAAMLVEGALPGIVMIIPAYFDKAADAYVEWKSASGPSQMFGGNFAATSDSRFHQAIEKITGNRFHGAVAIHDRAETWEQYERLSI